MPAIRANIIVVPENSIPEIFDPEVPQRYAPNSTFIKILGVPYKAKNSVGNTQYKVAICRGDLEEIEEELGQFEDLLFLSITEAPNNKLLLAINWELIELRPFIKEIADQISLTWSISKRSLHKLSISPFKQNEDDRLFSVITNVEPSQFFRWLEKDIRENAGGIYFLDTFDETRYETQFINSELFPPDTQHNYWEHHLIASTKVFFKNTETNHWVSMKEFPYWVILRIEFIRRKDNKNRLRLIADYVTQGTLPWFKGLETRIRLIFTQSPSDTEPKAGGKAKDEPPISKAQTAYIPTRVIPLRRWKTVWKLVKDTWTSKADFPATRSYLQSKEKKINFSDKTLKRILKAGDQGLLD
jgi:hypothetical protein